MKTFITLTEEHIKTILGPIVYIIYDSIDGSEIVYIGKSYRGFHRVCSYDHIHRKHIQNAKKIEIVPCGNKSKADTLEKYLIERHSPLYNINHNKEVTRKGTEENIGKEKKWWRENRKLGDSR